MKTIELDNRIEADRASGVTRRTKLMNRVVKPVAAVVVVAALGITAEQTGAVDALSSSLRGYETQSDLNKQGLEDVKQVKIGTVDVLAGATYRKSPTLNDGRRDNGDPGSYKGIVGNNQRLTMVNPLVLERDGDTWLSCALMDQEDNTPLPTTVTPAYRQSHSVWIDYTKLSAQGLTEVSDQPVVGLGNVTDITVHDGSYIAIDKSGQPEPISGAGLCIIE